jgi:hypothetical protein
MKHQLARVGSEPILSKFQFHIFPGHFDSLNLAVLEKLWNNGFTPF